MINKTRELGKGAFAEVREVTRKSDGKKFACKIIHKSKAKEEEEAIQCEISVLKQLHHSHVVGLQDMFLTKHHYYLVMDLAAGGELFERILERGFYTEKDAAEVVKQLLEGLVYIHDEVGTEKIIIFILTIQFRSCTSRFKAREFAFC